MHTSIDNSRPRLYILAGIPGCGKSTWARHFFSPSMIISTDVIRDEKWPGEPYKNERNQEVFDEFFSNIEKELEKGEDVVADSTGLNYIFRERLHTIARFYDAEKHLIFFDNIGQALIRNDQRKGIISGETSVPKDAQNHMLLKYKKARVDILGPDEFYESITIIGATL